MQDKVFKMSERVCLGIISGAHGIRGEVKVRCFAEDCRSLTAYGPLEDKNASRKFVLKITGKAKDDLRVKIQGCDDRNAAESLKGTELYIERSALPELEEDEFYHTDLIGLDVKEEGSSEVIGKVAALYNFGANDIIEIKVNKTAKLEMLPFNKQYVPQINIKDGFIIIREMSFAPESGESDEG